MRILGIVLASSLAFGFLVDIADAQTDDSELKPKNFAIIDANGVDVSERRFNVSHTISIGDPNNGGMTYSATHSSPGVWRFYHSVLAFARWDTATDPDTGSEASAWTLQFEGRTEYMGSWGMGNEIIGELGSRLVYCGVGCLTGYLSDGTVLQFESTPIQVAWGVNSAGFIYQITSATKPNGDKLEFHYLPGGVAIRSITNNHGYQLRFEHSNPNGGQLWKPNSVVLFNMAIDPCNPDAASCPPFTRTWPRLSFEGGGLVAAVTETGGARTEYSYSNDGLRIEYVDGPGTRDIDITYQDCGPEQVPFGQCWTGGDWVGGFRVSTVTKGGRTWSYSWDPSVSPPGNSKHEVAVTSAAGTVKYTSAVWVNFGHAFSDLIGNAPRILSIRDELGRTTNVGYVGWLVPQVAQITYPDGDGVQYVYDQRVNIEQIRRFAKPGSGLADRVIQIQRGESGSTSNCAQPAYCNKPVLIRDARGYVTRNVWNTTTGLLLSTEAGLQGPDSNLTCSIGSNKCPKASYSYTPTSAYFYNAAGQMAAGAPISKLTSSTQCETATTCAAGSEILTTMGYGAAGVANNLLLRSLAIGKGGQTRTTGFAYDDVGNRRQIDGPRADVLDISDFKWDSDRRLTHEIAADMSATQRTYSPEGYLETFARGVVNGSGQFTAHEAVVNGYDTGGNLIRLTGPAGVTQYSYDAASRLTCIATRMNPSVYLSLPTDACTLSTQGAYGPDRITRNIYDAAGQVTTVQRAYATSLQQNYASYGYTSNGKQDWVEDANGNRSDFSYDGFDRLFQLNFPQTTLGAHAASPTDYEQYGYDANGNRTSRRLRSTETITYGYDALNRETLRDIPIGTALDVYSEYDLLGRRLAARFQSPSGEGVIYTYDPWGGVLSEATHGRTMSYQYDAAGNRTFVTWPDGNFVQYTYDVTNRMDQVRENGATSGPGLLADYSYDVLGRPWTIARGNGATTTLGYDGASRISSFAHNLTGATQDLTLGFAYNPASQIVTRTISADVYGYVPEALVSRSYAPDGLNRYASVSGVNFSHDARGNLTNNGTRAFTYDLENHLTLVTGASGTPTQLTLSYDPLGRLRQTVAGATTARFLNAGDQLVAEFNGASTTPLRRYVHGAAVDEPLVWYEGAQMSSATRRWLHADHQGSVVGATDDSGALVGTPYSYSPYGQPDSTNDWTGSRFRYTGQIMLPEVNLYHYKARVYDPVLGRFLQTDPIRYEDDLNLYAYVRNDPLNQTDPTGMAPPGCGGGCPPIKVEIRAYPIQGGFGYHHEYVHVEDVRTGESIISSAGPSAHYNPSNAIFDQTQPQRGSKENIKLVTEMGPADEHSNRPEAHPGTTTVSDSSVTINRTPKGVRRELERFNESVDSAKIDYRGRSTNSNAYAGTAYRVLTGQTPPEFDDAPGSDVDLRPIIEEKRKQ